MIVAKVGGSLYDWPGLTDALDTWLASVADHPVLLVPGGGVTANAIGVDPQASASRGYSFFSTSRSRPFCRSIRKARCRRS